MDAHTYPGKGLSLSQLVFALNEELKRTAYSPSFTFDKVSQLDRDASTALANIREWRNSFVYINRVPLDILSLIPTHLHSEKDRFRASYVCRHWRRTFLQHAALWSRVFLAMSEVYVKTLLERAKGSPLEIITNYSAPVGTIALLSPYAQQITYLNFIHDRWTDVQRFSEVNSGPLPLLRTLEINADFRMAGFPDPVVLLSLLLFGGAVNLKQFVLRSHRSPFLNHFVFPNLTTFELSITQAEVFRASELLNFLEASPVLRNVHMRIIVNISLEGVARGRVVTLPRVQTFSLAMNGGVSGYDLAAHISCPSASHALLTQEKRTEDMNAGQDTLIFPTTPSWNAIARQYTRSPVEAVTLEIKPSSEELATTYTLTFRSLDMTVIRLGLEVPEKDDNINELQMSFEDAALEVFSQASRTIREHPRLPDVKRLCIRWTPVIPNLIQLRSMANEIERLFKSVGPLDELTLDDCDLRPYLTPFLDLPGFEDMEQPITFPPIKEISILHPSTAGDGEEWVAAVAELAKSQHALGIPFERVTVRAEKFPMAMAEMLKPWVGEADCYRERYVRAYD